MLAKLNAALIAAALSAGVAATPAFAATGDALPASSVSYHDLDLSTAEGAARLDRRVKAAVDRVCGRIDPRDSTSRAQIMECRHVAMNQARPGVALAVATARGDRRLALNGSAPSIRLDAH